MNHNNIDYDNIQLNDDYANADYYTTAQEAFFYFCAYDMNIVQHTDNSEHTYLTLMYKFAINYDNIQDVRKQLTEHHGNNMSDVRRDLIETIQLAKDNFENDSIFAIPEELDDPTLPLLNHNNANNNQEENQNRIRQCVNSCMSCLTDVCRSIGARFHH